MEKLLALKARLYSKVEMIPFNECYEWVGRRNSQGYGIIDVGPATWGVKQFRAHRAMWEVERGKIPEGMFVCHSCDNPGCIRIEHLFLGTNSENMIDMHNKGRGFCKRLPPEEKKKRDLTAKTAYREKHRDEIRAKGREYEKQNRSKMNEYRRKWRRGN